MCAITWQYVFNINFELYYHIRVWFSNTEGEQFIESQFYSSQYQASGFVFLISGHDKSLTVFILMSSERCLLICFMQQVYIVSAIPLPEPKESKAHRQTLAHK